MEVVHNVPDVHTVTTVLAFSSTLRRMLVSGSSSESFVGDDGVAPFTAAIVAYRCCNFDLMILVLCERDVVDADGTNPNAVDIEVAKIDNEKIACETLMMLLCIINISV